MSWRDPNGVDVAALAALVRSKLGAAEHRQRFKRWSTSAETIGGTQQLDGRSGAVFSLRLPPDVELVLRKGAELQQLDERERGVYRWGYGGSPAGVGTFVREAAIEKAKRLIDAAVRKAEKAASSGSRRGRDRGGNTARRRAAGGRR